MPGWRIGFCSGNAELIGALARLKSYFDYGHFTPVQVAGIEALNNGDEYGKKFVICINLEEILYAMD